MKIHEINAITGVEQTRNATKQEIEEIQATQKDAQKSKEEFISKINAEMELKEIALKKLIDLGLTRAEAEALVS